MFVTSKKRDFGQIVFGCQKTFLCRLKMLRNLYKTQHVDIQMYSLNRHWISLDMAEKPCFLPVLGV